MRRTPLALFVYNRPRHTARALEAISRLEQRDQVDLIIYSDAPKHEGHAEDVQQVRAIVRDYAAANGASVVERSENFGLARSIAGSVSELTDTYGRVIVLEDDLVPAPDFLRFMLEGLDRYEAEESILQIAGCLLPGAVRSADKAFMLPLTTTWGWATWKRAWTHFKDVSPSERASIDTDADFKVRFNAEGAADYVSMLDDRLAGRNDSWGILWWHAVAKARGLVLYPSRSLIWNGGFDSSGVHCGGEEEFQPSAPGIFQCTRLSWPVQFPTEAKSDPVAWAAVVRFLKEGRIEPERDLLTRVKGLFKQLAGA